MYQDLTLSAGYSVGLDAEQPLRRTGATVCHSHLVPVLGEALGDRQPDAPIAAGNQYGTRHAPLLAPQFAALIDRGPPVARALFRRHLLQLLRMAAVEARQRQPPVRYSFNVGLMNGKRGFGVPQRWQTGIGTMPVQFFFGQVRCEI